MQFPIIQAFRNKLSNYSHSDNQSALEMRYSLIWFILSPYSQLEAIIGGNQSDTSVGEFLSRVVIATQPVTNNTTRPSDLLIAVNILLTLAEYNNASQGNISSEEDVHNLATVVSNLLDPGNAITWQNLEQVRTLPRWAARPVLHLWKIRAQHIFAVVLPTRRCADTRLVASFESLKSSSIQIQAIGQSFCAVLSPIGQVTEATCVQSSV